MQNTNADGLSRLLFPTKTAYVPVPEEMVLSLSIVNDTPITATKIAQWTAQDPVLSKVLNFVLQGWPPVVDEEFTAYHRRKDDLSIELWGSRVIIPAPGREELLNELHEYIGIVRMKALARS